MNRFDYRAADYTLRNSWGNSVADSGFEIFDNRCAADVLARCERRSDAEKIVKALNDVEAARAEVARMCAAAKAA